MHKSLRRAGESGFLSPLRRSRRFRRGTRGIPRRKAPTCVFIFRAEALTEYQGASGIHKCPLQNREPAGPPAWSDVRRQQGVCPQNNSDLTFPQPGRQAEKNRIQNSQNHHHIFPPSSNMLQHLYEMIFRNVGVSLLRGKTFRF